MVRVTTEAAAIGQQLRAGARKERGFMAKAKTKTLGSKADVVRPYVERAISDEKLRTEVMRAFSTARELYDDLIHDKDKPIVLASRVATDDDVRDKLRDAIEDLRSAGDRLQGKRERSSHKGSTLLVAGIALGILFNPVTGSETRRFIRDLISGGGHERHADPGSESNGRG
jgi:hypothetical protein